MWLVRAADAGLRDSVARLHAVVTAIDADGLHNHDHSDNVARYAVGIGRTLGLAPERVVKLQRAAFLHDVGKAEVPSRILAKRGPLTDEETERMQAHPVAGANRLAAAGLHEESRWVRAHHERADGRGYPDGLAGDEIPLEARIILVADSFEAMTSDRPYRRGMPVVDALEELRHCAGVQFDPEVVHAFAALVESGALRVAAVRDPDDVRAAAPEAPPYSGPALQRRFRSDHDCTRGYGVRVGRPPPGG